MNKFRLLIEDVDYSQYITYPITVRENRLEETLNSVEITLSRLVESKPFLSHIRAVLEWEVDDVIKESHYLILTADTVERIGRTNYYKHTLQLTEFIHYADLIALPDTTITRIEGVYEPTLLDVAQRIITIAGYETPIFNVEDLPNIKSPEWTFTRLTLLEALRLIYGYARLVPYAKNFNTIGGLQPFEEEVNANLYHSISESYDPSTYRTKLLTNVSNFIAEEGVDEPANGFMTVRSATNGIIGVDNAQLNTNLPIYKINKFEPQRWLAVATAESSGDGSVIFESVPNIPYEWFIEIPLYEKKVWDALPNTATFGNKGGSLVYEQGEPNIFGFGNTAPARWSWIPSAPAIKVITSWMRATTTDLSTSIKPEYRIQAAALAIAHWESIHGPATEAQLPLYAITFTPLNNYKYPLVPETPIFEMKFRVNYTPYIDSVVQTYRERKTNTLLTSQYYNQQANVIDSDVMAELHDKVSKANSGSERSISFLWRNYDDVIREGFRNNSYIITSATHNISKTTINSSYMFDQYYAKLNRYVAVLEKWRQFSIPDENIVDRQIPIVRFAEFSETSEPNDTTLDHNLYLDSKELKITTISSPGVSQIVIPCVSYPFNNAMMWEAKLPGNASAGDRSAPNVNNTRLNQPVRYTDENGRITGLTDIKYFTGFSSELTLAQSNNLPLAPVILNPKFSATIATQKDARERLNFSLQLHHIDNTGKVSIDKRFAAYNGMVGGPGINSGLQILLLNSVPHLDIVPFSSILANKAASFYTVNGSIRCPFINNTTTATAKSYAVAKFTDRGYEILYLVEEQVLPGENTKPLWINLKEAYN